VGATGTGGSPGAGSAAAAARRAARCFLHVRPRPTGARQELHLADGQLPPDRPRPRRHANADACHHRLHAGARHPPKGLHRDGQLDLRRAVPSGGRRGGVARGDRRHGCQCDPGLLRAWLDARPELHQRSASSVSTWGSSPAAARFSSTSCGCTTPSRATRSTRRRKTSRRSPTSPWARTKPTPRSTDTD